MSLVESSGLPLDLDGTDEFIEQATVFQIGRPENEAEKIGPASEKNVTAQEMFRRVCQFKLDQMAARKILSDY